MLHVCEDEDLRSNFTCDHLDKAGPLGFLRAPFSKGKKNHHLHHITNTATLVGWGREMWWSGGMAALELFELIYGHLEGGMAFLKCPLCRRECHACATARAMADCPICLRERLPLVCIVIPCGHAVCEGCMDNLIDRHTGEPLLDLRPVPPGVEALIAGENEPEEQNPFIDMDPFDDYQPPAPNYGDANDEAFTEGSDGENEAMVLEADTLPLPGAAAPRPKAQARPPPVVGVRPLHPAPPTPVAAVLHHPWSAPSPGDFSFLWEGELSAWVWDRRHNEFTLINPITGHFIVQGNFNRAPPCPHQYVSLWRATVNAYNRRWTLVVI